MYHFKVGIRLSLCDFTVLLIPYLTVSAWYYLFYGQMLGYALRTFDIELKWVGAFFNLFIVLSLFVSSLFVNRFDKLRIIYLWATFMPILMFLLLSVSDLIYVFVLLAVLAAIFSVGLLAYTAYLFSMTLPEERGRVVGIMVFISHLIVPAFLYLITTINPEYAIFVYIFLGVITMMIRFLKSRGPVIMTTEVSSTIRSYDKTTFILYLIPWLIFCSINWTSGTIITAYLSRQFVEIAFITYVSKYLAASFGALLAGLFADWIGRRAALILGVIPYGVSTSFAGLAGNVSTAFLLMQITTGFGWGIFLVLYTLVIWGDIASSKVCVPIYCAGFMPFYLLAGLGWLAVPEILQFSYRDVAFVSGLLIFLSNIPLLLAPELLPQAKVERMKFHLWILRAKKIYEQYKLQQKEK